MLWSPQPSLHRTQALLFHRKLGQRSQKQSVKAWTPQTLKQYPQVSSLVSIHGQISGLEERRLSINTFVFSRSPEDGSHRGASLCRFHWSHKGFYQFKKVLSTLNTAGTSCSGLWKLALKLEDNISQLPTGYCSQTMSCV